MAYPSVRLSSFARIVATLRDGFPRRRWARAAVLTGIAFSCALAAVTPRPLHAAANGPLHSVADVRALPSWDLKKPQPVRVEGTLTLVDNARRLIVVQDATGAVALNVDSGKVTIPVGHHVVVEARDSWPVLAAIPDFPARPSGHELLPSVETRASGELNYVSRLRGYLHPPTTGEYRFWIASDDTSELWLGTDDDPRTARRIATATSWTIRNEWNHLPSQKSVSLVLEAGRRYYLEAIHEQRGGDDHLGVAWEGPGLPQQVIAGAHVSPWQVARPIEARIGPTLPSPSVRGHILREYWRNLTVESAGGLTALRQLESSLELAHTALTDLGPGVLPPPRPARPGQPCNPFDDYRWYAMEGMVEFVSHRGDALVLELADGDPRSRVVLNGRSLEEAQRLHGRRIRLSGVGESALNDAGRRVIGTLWVPPGIEPVIVEQWPEPDRYRSTSIAELLSVDPQLSHNRPVKLQGRVVSSDGNGQLTLSDHGAFYGYTSPDGQTWKQVGAPVEISMGDSLQIGLVVNSRSSESSATAIFDQVAGLPKTFLSSAVGAAPRSGEVHEQEGRYTITGSGHDIWIAPDQFYFVHGPLIGAGEIIARLQEWKPALGWSKAGLMIRDSLAPDAQFVDLVQTGDRGTFLQWRKAAEGSAPLSANDSGTSPPMWLKLARRFNTIQVNTGSAGEFVPGTPVEVAGYVVGNGEQLTISGAAARKLPERQAPAGQSRPLIELAKTRGPSGNFELDLLKVRAVVTFSGQVGGRGYVAIQDHSGATFLTDKTPAEVPSVRVGQFVEVHSNPSWASPSPDLTASNIFVLGTAVLPKPVRHPSEYVLPRRGEASWVEVEGVVRSVNGSGQMQLRAAGDVFSVAVEGASPEQLHRYVDATLRLRGVIAYPSERERLLLVPSLDQIDVLDTAPSDPFELPLQPMTGLAQPALLSAPAHRVRVRGVVTLIDHNSFYLQDGAIGARVDLSRPATLSPGNLVEVAGFPDLAGDRSPLLSNAVARAVGTVTPPEPIAVSGNDILAGGFGSRLVRLKAVFSRVRSIDGEHTLELQLDQRIFRATVSSPTLPSLPPGTLVEVTGICALETALPEWIRVSAGEASILPARLLLRSASDLVVLQKPRWWAVKLTLLAMSVTGFVVLVSIFWIQILRRRVAQRTAELRTTMQKLQHETQAAATLAERNRLAGEIHDSLEQGFSGVILQLDTTAKLGACPPDVRAGLSLARNMIAFSRNEVRHAVWDLQSPVLENSDLSSALKKIADQLAPDTGHTTLAVDGTPRPLSPSVEHHLLRIAQEAVANSVKHAGARHLDIALTYAADEIRLQVRDDGCGFVPEQVLTGGLGHFGLRSLRSRARKIQGTLLVTSAPGAGTVVEVRVPNPAE